jgi:pimeloyl-ACP methyl ester carboxylesterase
VPTIEVNGVNLFYSLTGNAGPPMVLVHGSWGDHQGWDPIVPALAQRFRVLAYDRRGHGQSERQSGQGSAEEDAADLAALIEHLRIAPTHVAGYSFGGSIALRLAARRPDLIRSLAVQEPPLFDLLANDPKDAPAMRDVQTRIGAVATRLAAGEIEEGTRQFMESVAFGPGAWELFSPEDRQSCFDNAPTFLDETRDPDAYSIDIAALAAFPRPALLTYGDQSPVWFPAVVAKLATVLPHREMQAFAGAGHVQHLSHPAEYAAMVSAFAATADAALTT